MKIEKVPPWPINKHEWSNMEETILADPLFYYFFTR